MPTLASGIEVSQQELDSPIWGQSGKATAKVVDGKIVVQNDTGAALFPQLMHPGGAIGPSPMSGPATNPAAPAAPTASGSVAPALAAASPVAAPVSAATGGAVPETGATSPVATSSDAAPINTAQPSALASLAARSMPYVSMQPATSNGAAGGSFTPRMLY